MIAGGGGVGVGVRLVLEVTPAQPASSATEERHTPRKTIAVGNRHNRPDDITEEILPCLALTHLVSEEQRHF